MDSELDLPPLPLARKASASELYDLHQKRKRSRLEVDVTTSSDPALFSSDDHAPSAENYVSKRRKEKWKGTWWGEKLNYQSSGLSNDGKRKFRRNFDSGVWMGSEGTNSSFEEDFLEDSQATVKRSRISLLLDRNLQKDSTATDKYATDSETFNGHIVHESRSQEAELGAVRKLRSYREIEAIIDKCLEADDENVDLSTLSLEDVPNKSLRRLRSLTKHTTMPKVPPSQEAYTPMEPSLRLYLSNNSLTVFPSEILNLVHLRVLSIRHNKLTTIPAGIANLPHLEQLNIAANELRYLPQEMLKLYRNPKFRMIDRPNPFYELPSNGIHIEPVALPDMVDEPILKLRGMPTYMHANGSKINPSPPPMPHHAVPSLLELALQSCQNLPDLSDLQDWCVMGEGPHCLSAPLAMALEAKESSMPICPTCGRSFLIPRVQWVEWWILPDGSPSLSVDDTPLDAMAEYMTPLLRRACSWACWPMREVKDPAGLWAR